MLWKGIDERFDYCGTKEVNVRLFSPRFPIIFFQDRNRKLFGVSCKDLVDSALLKVSGISYFFE